MNTIAVTIITQDDLRAAPAWVHHLLQQWAPPSECPIWDIHVYTEIITGGYDQEISMHMDVLTPAGSVMATGEHFPLFRHLTKANLATVARGACLSFDLNSQTALPRFIVGLEWPGQVLRQFPEEMAWLLGITQETVDALVARPEIRAEYLGADILHQIRTMNPGIDEAWKQAFTDAITAVNLL